MVICCFDFGCLLLLPFCAGRGCGLRIFGLGGFMVLFDLGFLVFGLLGVWLGDVGGWVWVEWVWCGCAFDF